MCAQQLSLLTPPGQAEAPSVQCCAGGRGPGAGVEAQAANRQAQKSPQPPLPSSIVEGLLRAPFLAFWRGAGFPSLEASGPLAHTRQDFPPPRPHVKGLERG